MIATIPLDSVGFGGIVSSKGAFQAIDRPMIVYGPQTQTSLQSIDLSIQDVDRRVLPLLGSGEVWATVRVWLKSR